MPISKKVRNVPLSVPLSHDKAGYAGSSVVPKDNGLDNFNTDVFHKKTLNGSITDGPHTLKICVKPIHGEPICKPYPLVVDTFTPAINVTGWSTSEGLASVTVNASDETGGLKYLRLFNAGSYYWDDDTPALIDAGDVKGLKTVDT